ncbi:hypothetical protein HYU92_06455 [Candidatus Curtissbacteria bacterium]|nr:hypothetical protein [Candidatus Curtissbacteria bacterium]
MDKRDSFFKKAAVGASLILFLQLIGPFEKPGIFWGHDSHLHLINLKQFEQAIREGQFPVRVIDWIVPGYNQPLFNFYQPGFFYIYLAPKFLGLPMEIALKVTLISLWFTSAALMFLFIRSHFGTLPAILAAYFWAIAPYHILDILVRAALPEFTALAFAPGIFWSIKKYFDARGGFWLTLLAFFIAATTVSHLPTIIIFSPLILFYIIHHLFREKSKKAAKHIGLAVFVGFGLASFFLIPAAFEQNFINTNYLRSGHFDFRNHFVCIDQLFKPFWGSGASVAGCNDGMSFQLGIVHWLTTAMLVAILILRFLVFKGKKPKAQIVNINILSENDGRLFLIALGGIALSIFMMLAVSQPIWETLPGLPYILYAWRFLAPATFLSSLAASGLILIFAGYWRYFAFVTLMLAATIAYNGYLKPLSYVSREQANIIFTGSLSDREMESYGFFPEAAFMPKWTRALPAENDRPINEIKIETDSAEINSATLKAHLKEYVVQVKKPTMARFYTHYFPGWKVFIDGREVRANYDNVYGYMDVAIPTGSHQVKLSFENTPIRTFANLLTIIFAAVALSFILSGRHINGNHLRGGL